MNKVSNYKIYYKISDELFLMNIRIFEAPLCSKKDILTSFGEIYENLSTFWNWLEDITVVFPNH